MTSSWSCPCVQCWKLEDYCREVSSHTAPLIQYSQGILGLGRSGRQAVFGLTPTVVLGHGTGVSLSTLTGEADMGVSATTPATKSRCQLSGISVNPDVWVYIKLQSRGICLASQGAKSSTEEAAVWILGK